MTEFEVRKMCIDALYKNEDFVILVFPKGYGGCLFGTHGPKGELRSENKKGQKVYAFDPLRVLQYLKDNKT